MPEWRSRACSAPAYLSCDTSGVMGGSTPGAIGTPPRPSRKALSDDRFSQTAVSPPVSRTGRHTADRDTPYQQLRAAQRAIGYRVGLRKGPDRVNSGLCLAEAFKTTAIRHPSASNLARFRRVARWSARRPALCHRTCHPLPWRFRHVSVHPNQNGHPRQRRLRAAASRGWLRSRITLFR